MIHRASLRKASKRDSRHASRNSADSASVIECLGSKHERERAVFAASSVVKASERKRIARAIRSVVRGSLRTVRGWRGLAETVGREHPSLLTLVTHTIDDGDERGDVVLQLELSGRSLAAANLTAAHIRGPDAARPLVLLVGCDTRAPLAGYRGFAGRFLRHGAAIVVCNHVSFIDAVLLMAAKYGLKVCPHAGGVGLCEYVQHLAMIDYLCIAGTREGRVIEYVDHLHEHFLVCMMKEDMFESLLYLIQSNCTSGITQNPSY